MVQLLEHVQCTLRATKAKTLHVWTSSLISLVPLLILTVILRNGQVNTEDLSNDIDWSHVSISKTVVNSVPTWKMIFSGGLTAGVQLKNDMFQLVVEAGSHYKGTFEGLSFVNYYFPCFNLSSSCAFIKINWNVKNTVNALFRRFYGISAVFFS